MLSSGVLAVGVAVYLLIECIRKLLLVRYVSHLASHRTPLSEGFDRREWGEWMLKALQREAAMGEENIRQWVRSVFFETPVHELTRGDVDSWLRLYLSAREEGVDGPLEPWVRQLVDAAREVVEGSLGHRFPAGEATHPFERINHPGIDGHPGAMMVNLRLLPVAAFFRLARTLTDIWLRHLGFERWVDDPTGFVFWRLRRPNAEAPEERRALLFITGLGWGQAFYPHHAWAFARDAAFRARYSDVCLCELPGVSGVPLRAGATYPTAAESVAAVERFASREVELPRFDAVSHSAGAFVLSYAARLAPQLFERSFYAEAPCVFFTHAPKPWPILFPRFTYPQLLRAFWTLDLTFVSNWGIMSEAHHQHVLKNSTWFMECCHREAAGTLGAHTTLLFSSNDHYVNGKAVHAYMARYHPAVRVHVMEGWEHGAFWDPTNLKTVVAMLRVALCDDPGPEPTPSQRAALGDELAPALAQPQQARASCAAARTASGACARSVRAATAA